jgi:TRAP-type C4-dicarboxylate transport system substrate-binding protein
VYRRADLSRAMMLDVALLLTAVSTSGFAREFRAADTQSEHYPTLQALHYMGSLVAERSGGRLQLKVFHSRQLGEEKETLEQTRAGAIDLNRTNVALIGTLVPAVKVLEERWRKQAEAAGVKIITDVDRKPFEAAMAGLYAKAEREPAIAQLIERIRKVE